MPKKRAKFKVYKNYIGGSGDILRYVAISARRINEHGTTYNVGMGSTRAIAIKRYKRNLPYR